MGMGGYGDTKDEERIGDRWIRGYGDGKKGSKMGGYEVRKSGKKG
jgi:hypothetical protein